MRSSLFWLLLAALPGIAWAQASPPTLDRFTSAEYPAAALAAGIEGEVVFSLTIEADGTVSNAQILTPGGYGFDEAALVAVQKFLFKPATKDGTPVRAQIFYRYRFSLNPKNKQANPLAAPLDPGAGKPPRSALGSADLLEVLPPGVLTGKVFELGTRTPLAYAQVAVIDPVKKKVLRETTTDEAGAFTLGGLVPGQNTVKVVAIGYESLLTLETIPEQGALLVTLRLLPEVASGYGMVVRAQEESEEVSRRVLTSEELEHIPGTRGDVLKGIQNLPGIARTLLGLGGLVVRGSAPEDTQVFIDGLPVPLIYHFGGITSVISEDFLSGISFLPGVYSARYGRGMGGIIEVDTSLGEPPRLGGSVDSDIFDTGVAVKGPLPVEGMRYGVAVRRSYLDLPLSLAQAISPELSGVVFPFYWDYQAAVSAPFMGGNAQLIAFGSSDRFEITDQEDTPEEEFASLTSRFHRLQGSWKKEIAPGLYRRASASFGITDSLFLTPPFFEFELHDILGAGRVDWANKLSETVSLRYGADMQLHKLQSKFLADLGEDLPTFVSRDNASRLDAAVYVEGVLTPFKGVSVIPGLRADWLGVSEEFTLDPRLTARWDLSLKTALKVGAGVFHQDPKAQDFMPPDSPTPHPQYATQATIGVERSFFDERLQFDASTYYKHLSRQIVRGFTFGEFPAEILTTEGEGRVMGLEILLRYPPKDRFFGWIAYSLSRADRRPTPSDDWVRFDLDQTHNVTMIGSYQLNRNITIGGRFRYISGNPYTPVVSATFDADFGGYIPELGTQNSARIPPFHQLDIRIDKKYRKETWSLTLYLEVTNVYNNRSIEFEPDYNFDFSQAQFEKIGLPIIPVLGLEGEF